jgi:hypothetical protein
MGSYGWGDLEGHQVGRDGTASASLPARSKEMAGSLFPTPTPSGLGPESSVAIVIVAVLFLMAVFAFYYFTM